jgi:hypothetical protein
MRVDHCGIEAKTKREWLEKALEQGLDIDGCWVWPWGKNPKGYGMFSLDGKMRRVPVVACEHAHGPKPSPNHEAAHAPGKCNNPSCFRPDHLRWATRAENAADKKIDGTENVGERHGLSKLTESQVVEIIALLKEGKYLQREIGEMFGVHPTAISDIAVGKTWKHLPR